MKQERAAPLSDYMLDAIEYMYRDFPDNEFEKTHYAVVTRLIASHRAQNQALDSLKKELHREYERH